MKKKNLITVLIVLTMVIFGCLTFLPKNPSSKKEVLFNIEKGEGSRDIAINLEKEGLIRFAPIFRIYVLTVGVSEKLQAGKYELSPSMSIYQMAKRFASGDVAKKIITIPEGFTVKQIEEKLNITIDPNLEGFLFPDTYHFSYDAAPGEIVEIMRDNFEKKITQDLREEIARQNKTISEIITMASLIEKEVKTKKDKDLVSGILWKRLKIGMALQVDSEMWTYENRGLPPAPICNPGLESIKSAVYPENSEYWYYLSTEEGRTIFSRTLEEHNAARAKYLKLKR
jgi:UPF0755 protein